MAVSLKGKTVLKSWYFESSSSDKTYETIKWTDGTLSCDCPGWCKRTAPDGSRDCKHVRMVNAGVAERECVGKKEPDEKIVPYSDDFTKETEKEFDMPFISPMLARRFDLKKDEKLWDDKKWVVEKKFNGHRLLATNKVCYSRLGTEKQVSFIQNPIPDGVMLDGEVLLVDEKAVIIAMLRIG